MKKQSYILLSSLLLLAACSQKEEAVYGEGASYVQRTNQTLSDYAATLEGTPQWLLTLYAGEKQAYGGHNVLVSFAHGKVTAASEELPTEETSDYSLLFGEKAILSFDTYNKVLHYFVEPSFLFVRREITSLKSSPIRTECFPYVASAPTTLSHSLLSREIRLPIWRKYARKPPC